MAETSGCKFEGPKFAQEISFSRPGGVLASSWKIRQTPCRPRASRYGRTASAIFWLGAFEKWMAQQLSTDDRLDFTHADC